MVLLPKGNKMFICIRNSSIHFYIIWIWELSWMLFSVYIVLYIFFSFYFLFYIGFWCFFLFFIESFNGLLCVLDAALKYLFFKGIEEEFKITNCSWSLDNKIDRLIEKGIHVEHSAELRDVSPLWQHFIPQNISRL